MACHRLLMLFKLRARFLFFVHLNPHLVSRLGLILMQIVPGHQTHKACTINFSRMKEIMCWRASGTDFRWDLDCSSAISQPRKSPSETYFMCFTSTVGLPRYPSNKPMDLCNSWSLIRVQELCKLNSLWRSEVAKFTWKSRSPKRTLVGAGLNEDGLAHRSVHQTGNESLSVITGMNQAADRTTAGSLVDLLRHEAIDLEIITALEIEVRDPKKVATVGPDHQLTPITTCHKILPMTMKRHYLFHFDLRWMCLTFNFWCWRT